MSTLKRLFNVGKGKAKVATRGLGERSPDDPAAPRSAPGLLDEARHAAADAAEAFAEVVRPSERAHADPSAEPEPAPAPAPAPAPIPTVPTDRAEPEVPPARAAPRKRTL